MLLELADEASDEATGKEAVAAAKAVGKALDDLEFRRMLSGEFDGQGAIVIDATRNPTDGAAVAALVAQRTTGPVTVLI